MLKWISVLSFVTAAVVLGPIAHSKSPWPTISGDVSSQECVDAFRLARTMFNSTSSRLYAPPQGVDELASDLVLQPSGLDISGGHALKENPAAWDQLAPVKDNGRSVYWQKSTQDGVRIAVVESSVGWRGDMYSLYLLPSDLGSDSFLLEAGDQYGKATYAPLIRSSWRPPLVFQTRSKPAMWFIEVGEPYGPLSPWRVFRATSTRPDPICTIAFRPIEVQNMTSLLPEPVAAFALLLDETIGPGNDEGTLQPTASLRVAVQHVWAHVALRPWAISEANVYNSREEVDAGLIAWSRRGPSYLRHYDSIVAAYPAATHSLADYYEKTFSLPGDKARSLAEYVLDVAMRANYTFPNGGDYFRYDGVNNNPWKSHD